MLCHATVILLLLLLLLLYTPQHRYCFYYSCTLVLLACTPATTTLVGIVVTVVTVDIAYYTTACTPILLYSYLLHKHMFISYTHYLYGSHQTSVLFTPILPLLIFLLSHNHACSQLLHSLIIML